MFEARIFWKMIRNSTFMISRCFGILLIQTIDKLIDKHKIYRKLFT